MEEIYISVDVEASGPIPGEYSMLSLGACLVSNTSSIFYTTLKPINRNFVPEALKVARFSLEELERSGLEPELAMGAFEDWVKGVSGKNRPIFVAFNATFDWQFVNYYFHKYLGRNPFGISGLDIKAYYAGKFNTTWAGTAKKRLGKAILPRRKHTHNALDDAIEQAELFRNILEFKK